MYSYLQFIAQLIARFIITFVNTETIRKAYLGKHAQSWVIKSAEQIQKVYEQRGIVIPVAVSSTLHCICDNEGASLADIARHLDIPHQLVAQRIGKLTRFKLVKKCPDPNDKRRSEYFLTALGQEQAKRLMQCMDDAALIYSELFDEIGCDLAQVLLDAVKALERNPLDYRFARKFDDPETEND